MKRRFLSILLCLLLAVQLLPAGALAAGEGDASAVTLEAGGVSISGTTDAPAYAATDSEGVVTPGTESDPWNIRWDGQTLTLKNAVIHSEEAFGIALTFHSKSDVTIELEGTNQVSSATWANGRILQLRGLALYRQPQCCRQQGHHPGDGSGRFPHGHRRFGGQRQHRYCCLWVQRGNWSSGSFHKQRQQRVRPVPNPGERSRHRPGRNRGRQFRRQYDGQRRGVSA